MILNEEDDKKNAKKALEIILNMDKRLPDDFDYKKELQEAREEKYGRMPEYFPKLSS